MARHTPSTCTRGQRRLHQKELLVQHLCDRHDESAAAGKVAGVLPELFRFQMLDLLGELRADGRIYLLGQQRNARRHIGSPPEAR